MVNATVMVRIIKLRIFSFEYLIEYLNDVLSCDYVTLNVYSELITHNIALDLKNDLLLF